MIAKLRGLVDSSGDDWVIVDVSGVGYLVFCSGRTLARLPGAGEAISLLIEMHVREDHIHLFGFPDPAERDWFRLLQTVQGVGAKVALAILTIASPQELGNAIAVQDKTTVTRASGVGPKLGERIVNELKDKVAKLAITPAARPTPGVKPLTSDNDAADVVRDAVSALTNLGYRPGDAYTAVSSAANTLSATRAATRELNADDLQTLIRQGLKELAK